MKVMRSDEAGKMIAMKTAAMRLDLLALKALKPSKESATGLLLDACSAHDPDGKAQEKMILHLLKLGADVNGTDKNGVTPLHRAVRFRSPSAVSLLIEKGAEVNCRDKKTWSTPLHRAVTSTGAPATKGKAGAADEIIRILLDGGADPKIKNRMGKTPKAYVKVARFGNLPASRGARK